MTQFPNLKMINIEDGLSQMKVSSVYEDSRGYVWIGTRNGLNRFDGKKYKVFTHENGLLNNRILDIKENSVGELIVLTAIGLSVYDGSMFSNFEFNFPEVEYDLIIDKNDICHIRSYSNYIKFNGSHFFDSLILKTSTFYLNKNKDNLIILSDYILSENNGKIDTLVNEKVKRLDIKLWTPYSTTCFTKESNNGIAYTMSVDTILPIFELSKNTLNPLFEIPFLYADYGELFYSYNGKARGQIKIPVTNVSKIYRDSNKDYWIGSDQGVVKLSFSNFEQFEIEDISNAWSVLEDENNKIWFSTYGSHLYSYSYESNKFSQKETVAPSGHFMAGACQDSKNIKYFPSAWGCLKIENSIQHFISNENTFYSVFDENKNQLIIGVNNGIKVFKESGDVDSIMSNEGMHANFYIQNITIDKNGNYWCGSYTGLSRYDLESEKVFNFTNENGNLPAGNGVFCGLLDAKDRLWFGGQNGLMSYDYNSDKLKLIKSDVINKQIKSILELPSGDLLLGTIDGLICVDIDHYLHSNQIVSKRYNLSNGFNGLEPLFTGLFIDSKGYVWILTSTGVHRIHSKYLTSTEDKIGLVIEKINGVPVPFNVDTVNLTITENSNIVISLNAVGKFKPQNIQFKYKINDTWSEWNSNPSITLTKLSNGKNIIDLAVGPIDSSNFITTKTAIVTVNLPLFKRAYFIPSIIGLTLLFIFLSLYSFLKRKSQNKRFKKQIEELKYLKSQLLLSEMNPHFIFNVLATIQNKIIKGNRKEANDSLVQLSGLIRSYLSVSYNSNNVTQKTEFEIDLKKEVELLRLYLTFEKELSNNHFDYTLTLDKTCQVNQIYIPPMLLQPFVENALKHGILPLSKRGNINIHFSFKNSILECIIRDDGVGIDKSTSNKFPQSIKKSLGSKIVKERIEILNTLGYEIKLNTQQLITGGTQVTLTIKE